MVEDSIAKIFSGSLVSVAAVDVVNSIDSDIKNFIDGAHCTYSVALSGESVWNSYIFDNLGIVVIDKDGVVQMVTYDLSTGVSDAASKVRSLLGAGIVRPKAAAAFAGRNSNNLPRYYTLSGQTIAHPAISGRAAIVLRRLDGRVTGAARFAK